MSVIGNFGQNFPVGREFKFKLNFYEENWLEFFPLEPREDLQIC